jgi:hypothetical protein
MPTPHYSRARDQRCTLRPSFDPGFGRAAYDRATFDDSHLQPGAGEVSSTGEAIVARSNDHYVTLIHRRSAMSFRSGDYRQANTIFQTIAR